MENYARSQMEIAIKCPNHATFRREPGIFRAETPRTERPKHLFRPLFPRNPLLFPGLRSGHRLFQQPSPQKQIPSNSEMTDSLSFVAE
jgi:hypothetical protein